MSKPVLIGLLALSIAAPTVASAQTYGPPPPPPYHRPYHHWRHHYYRDYRYRDCYDQRRAAGNQGAVLGAVGGGILGSALGGGRLGNTLLGAGAGAVAGHAIAKSSTHC